MPFRPIAPPSTAPTPRQIQREPSHEPAAVPPSPPVQKSQSNRTSSTERPHHKVDRSGPNWDEDGDYIVGKGRPPKASRWQKGQSGNPRGPVKRENLTAQQQLEQAMLAPFTATVNGEPIVLTMDVFAVQSLKNAAAKGSVRAAQILLETYTALVRKLAAEQSGPEVAAWEQEAIDRLLAELDLPDRPVVRVTDRRKGQL